MLRTLRWWSPATFALLALVALYVVRTIHHSQHFLLWFDEFATLDVVAQPTFRQMFQVAPAAGSPPLQYLLIRPCVDLLGLTVFSLRLPALIGVGMSIVCVFLFLGRRVGPAIALTVAALLTFSPVMDYGLDARPYALLLGLTSLALVLWQKAASGRPRTAALIGLSVTIFALVITHVYGLLWAVCPLGSGEIARAWRSRRIDVPMLIAILVGATGFAITLHVGHQTQAALFAPIGKHYQAKSLPSLYLLKYTLRSNGSVPPVLLMVLLAPLLWARRQKLQDTWQGAAAGAPLHEWVAAVSLILTGFLVFAVTFFVTHYFFPRYIVPSALGCFLLLGLVCGAVGNKRVVLAVFALGILVTLYEARPRRQPPHSQPVEVVPWTLHQGPPIWASADPAEPIVVENAIVYPLEWWYSPQDTRKRLHYIGDAHESLNGGDFIGDLTMMGMHNAGSQLFPTDTLQSFLGANQRFLLWQTPNPDPNWLSRYLQQNGYHLVIIARNGYGETLQQVTAP